VKVIILGASGKIGTEVALALEPRHEVVRVGSRGGEIQAEYTDKDSVRAMFEASGGFDAFVCVVGGDSVFKPYEELTDDDFEFGFRRKILAPLNLVKVGLDHANDGASFVLSSGFLSHYPNRASVATGPFNAAIDSLVSSIAPLLPRRIRINVVSPAPVVPSERASRGLVSADQVARYYVQCVEGDFTGQVLRAWGGLEETPIW
jgi:NAD(P)-dependent dehydrogenase (short-subunit alcohol dehydrogenase family)